MNGDVVETKDPLEAAADALAGEGYENVTEDFDLSAVDVLTRWVAATAMEKVRSRKYTDREIQDARTLADLL
ncbi:MAG: hypothetical protein QM705_04525 [Ancrocorticia sp.]